MSSTPRLAGSQIQLTFQSKFPTFTPEQFNSIMKEKKYFQVQAQISTPGVQSQPVLTPVYSKANVSVLLNPGVHQIIFQILNTIGLTDIIENEIKPILVHLNVSDESVAHIILNCSTVATTQSPPIDDMTRLLNKKFLDGVSEVTGKALKMVTIKLATEFPTGKDGLQVLIEPLASSPKNQYWLTVLFQASTMKSFNEFINEFGDKMIQDIVKEVNKSA